MWLYSFSWQKDRYALVSDVQAVNRILKEDSIWLYTIPGELFEPIISCSGAFAGEWVSSQEICLTDNCKCQKINWNDIQAQNIHVLYVDEEKQFHIYRKMLCEMKTNKQRKEILEYCLSRGYLKEYTGGIK